MTPCAQIAAELALLRRQLAREGPAFLAHTQTRLQEISGSLTAAPVPADPAELASLRRELSQLTALLAAGDTWCGNLVQLLSSQTEGYGTALNLRSNRLQVVG